MALAGIGGALGGLTRYQIGKMISGKTTAAFPLGTFIINISGALLLGFITGINVEGGAYILIGDGFLGAYTTFSTFMYEGFQLFQGKDRLNAFTYILCSLFIGIIGYAVGFAFGKGIIF